MPNPQPGVNPSCGFTVDPVAAGPGVCAWIAEARAKNTSNKESIVQREMHGSQFKWSPFNLIFRIISHLVPLQISG